MNNFRSQLTSKRRKDQELEAKEPTARFGKDRNLRAFGFLLQAPSSLNVTKCKEQEAPSLMPYGCSSLSLKGEWDALFNQALSHVQKASLQIVPPPTFVIYPS